MKHPTAARRAASMKGWRTRKRMKAARERAEQIRRNKRRVAAAAFR